MTVVVKDSYTSSLVDITVRDSTEIVPDVLILVPEISGSQLIYKITFKFNTPIDLLELTDINTGECYIESDPVSSISGEGDTWTANLVLKHSPSSSSLVGSNAYVEVRANSVENENGITGPSRDVRVWVPYDRTPEPDPVDPADSTDTVANFCKLEYDFNDSTLPFAYSDSEIQYEGGSIEGVLECIAYSGSVYAVIQISRYTSQADYIERLGNPPALYYINRNLDFNAKSITEEVQATAALIKFDVSTCIATVLKKYPNITTAARSLKLVGTKIYFFEGSNYAYYNEGDFYNYEIDHTNIDSHREASDYVYFPHKFERVTTTPFYDLSGGILSDMVPSQFRIISDTEIQMVIDRRHPEYQDIRNAFDAGRAMSLGNVRYLITGDTILSTSTSKYSIFSLQVVHIDIVDPTVDPPAPVHPEVSVRGMGPYHYLYVSSASYESVFSTKRFRNLLDDKNWKAEIGHLYMIDPANEDNISDLGLNWISSDIENNPNSEKPRPYYERDIDTDKEEQPIDRFYGIHGGTCSPIVWDGENLHLITGYGKLDEIDNNESEAARIDNWQWIQYGKNLDRRLVNVETNDRTVLQIIEDIAKITNSIIYFDGDKFILRPRNNIKAKLDFSISAADMTFTFKEPTRDAWPSGSTLLDESGLILIDNELIKYTSINGQSITDADRGAEGTTAAAHSAETEMNFVDHILDLNSDTLQQPISSISIRNEIRQVYNNIKISYGNGKVYPKKDDDSIAIYKNRELKISVPLDETQLVWVKHLADELLAQFKDLRQLITMRLAPTIYMNLGDAVLLKCSERDKLNRLAQLVDLQQVFKRESTGALSMQTVAKFLTL